MIPRGEHQALRARVPCRVWRSGKPVEAALRPQAQRRRPQPRARLAAADAVFAERGVEVGVPEIAARAGVGKATVYRSFPTKEHLIAAVVDRAARDLEAGRPGRLDRPTVAGALRAVADGASRQCADRSLSRALERASPGAARALHGPRCGAP